MTTNEKIKLQVGEIVEFVCDYHRQLSRTRRENEAVTYAGSLAIVVNAYTSTQSAGFIFGFVDVLSNGSLMRAVPRSLIRHVSQKPVLDRIYHACKNCINLQSNDV